MPSSPIWKGRQRAFPGPPAGGHEKGPAMRRRAGNSILIDAETGIPASLTKSGSPQSEKDFSFSVAAVTRAPIGAEMSFAAAE